ncbi:MAG: AAA family ATPase [Crocinitomicaceae bacterium]|nr:AAA family ATPase [Crocinitomicaceae bacterium]
MKSLQIELDDVSKEIENLSGGTEFTASEAQIIREKTDLFQTLVYKHNVQTADQLIEVREKLTHELTEIESVENAVGQTKKEIDKLFTQLKKAATTISEKRKVEAKALEKTIRSILINLSMADAELHIDLSDSDELNPFGQNEIEFQFKTNRGGQFLPLKKIASGGEMSRLMLAILSTLAATKNLPALIFDEIDTGVSGEVASRIASEFARMGKNLQLIAITHLPQVAGRGTHHLHVAKETEGNKTKTFIKKLNRKERIQELAKMISGEKVTDAAIENAENLLNFS